MTDILSPPLPLPTLASLRYNLILLLLFPLYPNSYGPHTSPTRHSCLFSSLVHASFLFLPLSCLSLSTHPSLLLSFHVSSFILFLLSSFLYSLYSPLSFFSNPLFLNSLFFLPIFLPFFLLSPLPSCFPILLLPFPHDLPVLTSLCQNPSLCVFHLSLH